MAKVYDTVYACFRRPEHSNSSDKATTTVPDGENVTPAAKHENDQTQQPGIVRRASSGLFALTTGVVGAGVGTVKWAASATYSVGSGVVNKLRKTDGGNKDKTD